MVAKQQGNSFSLVLPAGPGGWRGEGGTVEALWSRPAAECTPTAVSAHVPSQSASGRHPRLTAQLMIAGRAREAPQPLAVNKGSRWGQSDETARLAATGPEQRAPGEETLFCALCCSRLTHKLHRVA